jgi:hypothetical protein
MLKRLPKQTLAYADSLITNGARRKRPVSGAIKRPKSGRRGQFRKSQVSARRIASEVRRKGCRG